MSLTGVFQNCSKVFPCPICQAVDRCSILRARGIVNCRTVDANEGEPRTGKDGSHHWTHHLGRQMSTVLAQMPDAPPVAEMDRLHEVYSFYLAIIQCYYQTSGLQKHHVENLQKRGFGLRQAIDAGYRSNPDEAGKRTLMPMLLQHFGPDLLRLVPGVIAPKDDEGKWGLAGPEGILIPVRDEKNRIVSLKLRRDVPDSNGSRYCTISSTSHGGPSAHRAAHFPTPRMINLRRVRITEGELKADAVQRITEINTVSLPGVGAWRQAVPALKALEMTAAPDQSHGTVETVVVAFDADAARKPTVALCLKELVADLRAHEYEVEVETWDEQLGKGLDDLLLTGEEPEVLAGEDLDDYLKACLKAAGIQSVREELTEIIGVIEQAQNLIPVIETARYKDLLADVMEDAPTEWEYFKARVDAIYKGKWKSGIQRMLRVHQLERRQSEGEAIIREEDTEGLPSIETFDRIISDVRKDAVNALVAANEPPQLFEQGGRLVHLTALGERQVATAVDQPDLQRFLDDSAHWTESRGKRPVYIPCPPRYAQDMLSGKTDFTMFPTLRGTVHTPCFDRDGNLIHVPGLHRASGLYYHPKTKLEINLNMERLPTREEFERARGWVSKYMFGTLPFDNPAARAHAWALFLLPFVREMIAGPTPLHVINAPREGTGKGLTNFVCTNPFVPGGPEAANEPKNAEEWAKTLLSALEKAESHIFFDNINQRVDSGALALCLTESVYTSRRLGVSQMVSVPVRCVWTLAGNNVELSREIARRSVWIELDANCEDPSLLDFGGLNLREFVAANRASAVAAAITLIRWWLAHDCPLAARVTMGSYERWAEVMGGLLHCCEIEGFLTNQQTVLDDHNSDTLGWRAFVSEWWQKYGDQEVKARDLTELADVLPFWEELQARPGQAVSFGKKLEKQRNLVFLGKKITGRIAHNQRVYRLAVTNATEHDKDLKGRRAGRE